MSLKLLLFPTMLVIAFTIGFLYIRPDVQTILEQRTIETVKREALAKVATVETNLSSLSQSLSSRSETVRLVNRYLPQSLDQERAVDIVNFLAQQSGVVVSALRIKDSTPPPVAPRSVSTTLGADEEPSPESLVPPAPPAEPVKSYEVNVTVMGPYDNIRGFFERMHRTDRLHRVVSWGIQKPTDRPQEVIPENFLEGILVADFQYFSEKRAGNALGQPLFESDSIDFRAANSLADFINSPVGDLERPAAGRGNPFESLP